jgi:hypothetical protein
LKFLVLVLGLGGHPRSANSLGVATIAFMVGMLLLSACGGSSPPVDGRDSTRGNSEASTSTNSPPPKNSSQASDSDDQRPDPDFTPEPNPTEGPESDRSGKPKKRTGENKPVPSAEGDPGSMVLSIGDEGPRIRRLQRRLRDLSYWVGSVDGVFGSLTQQAVYAFQGIEGLARDGVVGPETRSALNSAGKPAIRSTNGLVVEINESAQVLMVAENGRIRWSFHTSTGTDEPYRHPSGQTLMADTPNGKWRITWQVDGWRDGRLGQMWRPKYFHSDGIAVHGFQRVPAFPASHGCARVTIPAMNFIWREGLAPQGSAVWVY